MNNKKAKSIARLEYLTELYNSACLAAQPSIDEFDKYMRQYLGDSEIDGSTERATTVRNITYEIIESEVNPDVPSPKVDPECYTEKRGANARTIERLCESIKERLPFEKLNDLDERYTYIMGASVWYVEWDSAIRSDEGVGDVRIHCLSPESFIPEPGISEVDEMDHCFLKFTTTKSELVRRYGVAVGDLSLAACEYQYSETGNLCDTVSVIVAFWKDDDGDVCKFTFSGSLILEDVEKYYYRRISTQKSEALSPSEERADKLLHYEMIDSKKLPEGFEDDILIPYFVPKSFPIVIRKNTAASPEVYGLSDCERIRPQQQAINKIESRILQKLIRAGITPVIPEDASVTLNNSVFGQVIKMRPGESTENYGKIDTTPDISQDIKEADRLYDQAKRVLGISDALQGTDTTQAESGYSRQLKISRAASRLETKKRIKYHTYSKLYRLIFEHYLAFADEGRTLNELDHYGNTRSYEFSRYAFIEPKPDGGYGYYSSYLFSVDLNDGTEYGREALWERNLENLNTGTLGDKSSPETLLRYWQSQERAHYPYARENVEYFKSILKELNENKEKESETT